MQLTQPYENLDQTLTGIKIQIRDSLEYVDNFLPDMDPGAVRDLWNLLKPLVTYHDDGDRELLQTAETLFENNVHGWPGAGDCDCFVILVSSCCKVLGWPCRIVLAGRSKRKAVHIFNEIHDGKKWVKFDLTAPELDLIRPYKYKQRIKI